MKKALGFLLVAALFFVGTLPLQTPDAQAYSYALSLRNARQTAIVTAIDAGGAAGRLEIGTAGMGTVLCTITFNYSPAGTVSSGVMVLAGFPKSCIATNAGTAAEARIRTAASVDVVTGMTVSATGGGGNIQIGSTTVTPGMAISLDHLTFTQN